MNVLWFLMDFCQVSYRCELLKVGKFDCVVFTLTGTCIIISQHISFHLDLVLVLDLCGKDNVLIK